MILLKIIIIAVLLLIFYQDFKERQVYWFLFPFLALGCAILFYNGTLPELFFVAVLLNLSFILFLLAIIFLYAKIKLKQPFKAVFGAGDVLLFLGLVFTFSTLSFLIVFVFSLFFSLLIHLAVSRHSKEKTVPLAGYMSFFFAIMYLSFWTGITPSLYAL